MVAKKKEQATNFIIDATKCPLDDTELIRQIGELYKSKRTRFIEQVILMRDGKILKIYQRK